MYRYFILLTAVIGLSFATAPAQARTSKNLAENCAALPDYDTLQKALSEAQAENNGGMGNNMWAAIVNRSGMICAIVRTGNSTGDIWPGSRLIAAAKANTANAFSTDQMALSTANLYAGAQPGGFLFGIQQNHPINEGVAYKGPASAFGTPDDPAVGEMLGGATVFGGGLALYRADGRIVGGLGVSGDTSCADHNIAWRTRHALDLDHVTKGMAKDHSDQIIFDIHGDKSKKRFWPTDMRRQRRRNRQTLSAGQPARARPLGAGT